MKKWYKTTMKSYLYLQRHGESETNVNRSLTCRKLDPVLTENGRSQIYNKTGFYENKSVELIVSSPSKRAMETAGIISRHLNLEFITDPDLYEIDTGDLEGLLLSDEKIAKSFYDILKNWIKGTECNFPNGESLSDVRRRINSVKEKYFHSEKNTVLVGHSAFYSILLSGYLKRDNIRDLFINRGGIAEYSYETDKWKLYE